MTTLLLVRHGRTTANTAGVLAGRSPGVDLDDTGQRQARDAAARIAGVPLAAAVSSPLRRCRHTAALLLADRSTATPELQIDRGLTECGYGEWTGRKLSELAKDKLWPTVQNQPSAVRFPGGETMTAMSARAVSAVRGWDQRIAAEQSDEAFWLAVSHGDVIKAILADALGMHLDAFQRIVVDPASISVIRYSAGRSFVVSTNSTAGDLSALVPPAKGRRRRGRPGDAAVGGGLGAAD